MSLNLERTLEEHEAASIVAALSARNNSKRDRDQLNDSPGQNYSSTNSFKPGDENATATAGSARPRVSDSCRDDDSDDGAKKPAAKKKKPAEPPLDATGMIFANPELKPAPFFYYVDHSLEQDDDPLTPVTAAGRIPTFPAKMHAILTNPALQDVVAWAPHGRSWRILKPRDFEVHVLPRYFEHSKFSSFVRQANGWGFRRLGQGRDRNAYYHEYFLRSMPWLCKKMRRPKVSEKKAIDPDMEPDFDAISEIHPVPDDPITREISIVQQTIEKGPRARMPVHWATAPLESLAAPSAPLATAFPTTHCNFLGERKPSYTSNHTTAANNSNFNGNLHGHGPSSAFQPRMNNNNGGNPQSAVNKNAFTQASTGDDSPDSQFAAGFMAATAFHSEHIRKLLGSAFAAGMPIPAGTSGNFFPNFTSGAGVTNSYEQSGQTCQGNGGNFAGNSASYGASNPNSNEQPCQIFHGNTDNSSESFSGNGNFQAQPSSLPVAVTHQFNNNTNFGYNNSAVNNIQQNTSTMNNSNTNEKQVPQSYPYGMYGNQQGQFQDNTSNTNPNSYYG